MRTTCEMSPGRTCRALVVALFAATIGSSCATSALFDWATEEVRTAHMVHAAYQKGDEILIEYSGYVRDEKPLQFWATWSPQSKAHQVSLGRLPPDDAEGATELELIDLDARLELKARAPADREGLVREFFEEDHGHGDGELYYRDAGRDLLFYRAHPLEGTERMHVDSKQGEGPSVGRLIAFGLAVPVTVVADVALIGTVVGAGVMMEVCKDGAGCTFDLD